MASKFKLTRTRQCAGCPWKKSVDPATIPNGFDYASHAQFLADQKPGVVPASGYSLRLMQCHDSTDRQPQHCVGWLVNQLGPGNNIGLRMRMFDCENIRDLRVDGEQREDFSDVVPQSEVVASTAQRVNPAQLPTS